MSTVRFSSYRFAPRYLCSHESLLSSRFIGWATFLGTPFLGGLAIAANYFRLSGFDNKVNGLMALVSGAISCCLMCSIVATSPLPWLTLFGLLGGSMWLAKATAFDSFASYYVARQQTQWMKRTSRKQQAECD